MSGFGGFFKLNFMFFQTYGSKFLILLNIKSIFAV